jgi:hypothetical protein
MVTNVQVKLEWQLHNDVRRTNCRSSVPADRGHQLPYGTEFKRQVENHLRNGAEDTRTSSSDASVSDLHVSFRAARARS